jgi:hypothetical protein
MRPQLWKKLSAQPWFFGSEINGSAERSTTMPLTGKEVWDAIVKAGFLSGPYDPRRNPYSANADVLAGLLNEVLSRRDNWLPPNILQTEDAMRQWKPVRRGSPCCAFTSFSTSVAIRSWASTRRLNAKQKGARPPLPLMPQLERRDREFTGLNAVPRPRREPERMLAFQMHDFLEPEQADDVNAQAVRSASLVVCGVGSDPLFLSRGFSSLVRISMGNQIPFRYVLLLRG